MTHGWMAQATYTLARGEDNAPLTGTYVVGSGDDRVSDPSNLDRDKGVTPFNQPHTLSVSAVVAPQVGGERARRRALNNNQFGIILQANSGLPFNIRSNLDLNLDGVLNDRPLDVERNAGRLGRVVNLDLRYSRFIPIAGWRAGSCSSRRRTCSTPRTSPASTAWCRPTRSAIRPRTLQFDGKDYPDAGKSGYDQRIMQLGVKLSF